MTTPRQPIYCLLVDDLAENLLSLEALLCRDGLVLLKAHSGPEALELLLQYDVALALVDIQMPVMDGFELAEIMRGVEKTKRVPIIFVTAGSTDEQRRFRGYEAGAVDFIQKPIEPDILRSKSEVFFELCKQRQKIASQRDELEIRAANLKEADRRKNEFLATLAHELRNPLTPISNGLQILRKASDIKSSGNVLDMMDRQLVHLVRLIDDLLDISRVTHGKIELRQEDMTLQSTIQSAIEASQSLMAAKGHKFIIDIDEVPMNLRGDPTRISQIITNLLNNAAKYTPDGGEVQLSARQQRSEAVIAVTDNGVGISKEMLPKVFQMFTQINPNVYWADGGLGIGLALVAQLVDLHGGSVHADSPGLGQGSTFTVRLKLTCDESGDDEKKCGDRDRLRN